MLSTWSSIPAFSTCGYTSPLINRRTPIIVPPIFAGCVTTDDTISYIPADKVKLPISYHPGLDPT